LLSVSPRHFQEHLEVMRRVGEPTALRRWGGASQGGTGRRTPIFVTFDDGYADNLVHARPLLEQHETPATVFVTSGFVGGQREFYWDELERVMLSDEGGATRSQVTIGGETFSWRGEGAGGPADRSIGRGDDRWNVLCEADRSPRQRLYRRLCHLLRPLPDPARASAMAVLRCWAGVQGRARPTHAVMTAEELLALGEGGLIEVGAHTVTHPMLSALTRAEQEAEVGRSKAELEAMVGRPVRAFSYPYGSRVDFDQGTIEAVRAAGFEYACANVEGALGGDPDPYRLPRFLVRDWDGDEFERRLRGWLSA
jgi:peptidoglycan/xylan/chitin deacetylase (PgdA/CDA1 family)